MELPESDIFTVPAKEYARLESSRYAGWIIGCTVAPLAVLAIAGMSDWRWWIVALMLLFIIFPMTATFAWFAIVGRPSMAPLLRPQRWTFGRNGEIRIDFYRFDRDKDPDPVDIVSADVESVSFRKRYDIVRLKPGSRYTTLLIPAGLMPDVFLKSFSAPLTDER